MDSWWLTTSNPPLRRRTKFKSVNPAAITKAAFFHLSVGLFLHILFLNILVILMGQNDLYMSVTSIIVGIPEIDMLLPILTLFLMPLLQLATDPLLSGLSLLPWIITGYFTGYIFGPNHENSIFFSFPVLFGSVLGVVLFSIITLIGIGNILPPSTELLIYAVLIVFGLISMTSFIGMISLFFIVPSFIGYYLGRRIAPRVYPLMFYGQPNRIDPDYTKCRFLTDQNICGVSQRTFIPNTCYNRFNQVTCPFYIRKIRHVNKKDPLGGLFSE
ncbi:MAG: hypothetical protein ACW98F_19480 [Candidatus Hodarchaeales archaeon]